MGSWERRRAEEHELESKYQKMLALTNSNKTARTNGEDMGAVDRSSGKEGKEEKDRKETQGAKGQDHRADRGRGGGGRGVGLASRGWHQD